MGNYKVYLLRTAIAVAVLSISPSITFAQNTGQFLEDQKSEIEEAQPKIDSGRIATPNFAIEAPEGADAVSLTLQSVTLVGPDDQPVTDADTLPFETARSIYAARIGQQITLTDLYEIAQEIDVLLKSEGFVFTRVLVPQQEFDQAEAAVKIRVLGTTIESVTIEEPEDEIGLVKDLIEDMVKPLIGKRNPNIADLERISLLASDLPGITRATFVPSPGTGQGTIALSLNVVRDPINVVGIITHRDSPTIGPGVFGGVAYLNTYGPFGASTEFSYFNSWSFEGGDLEERNTAQLTQNFFLSDGTEISFSGFASETSPSDVLENLQLSGSQYSLSVEAEHPLLRTRLKSVWVKAGFDWIDSNIDFGNNTATLTDDSSRVAYLGTRGNLEDEFGATSVELTLRKGLGILGATESNDPNVSRAGASGDFFLIQAEIERDQRLFGNFSADFRATGQFADGPLLASETISLGGSRYLKGYDPSEVQGDHGFAAYLELQYSNRLSVLGMDFGYQLYGFGDYGIVFQANSAQDPSDLMSTGFGGRLQVPDGPSLELEVVRPIGDERQRTNDNDARIFGTLVWFF